MTGARARRKIPRTAQRSNASEIYPGVFVGGWSDAPGFRGRRLCVLDEVPNGELPAEAHIPIYDEKTDRPLLSNLERAAQWVEDARSQGEPVLLFCGHGVRRGSLAGAWYLHRHEGVSLDAAYDRVRAVRPKIQHAKEWVGNWQILAER